jgi:hypothetical protein
LRKRRPARFHLLAFGAHGLPAISRHGIWKSRSNGWVQFFENLDRNSNVRFDKGMVAIGMQKSLVHGLGHSQLFHHS